MLRLPRAALVSFLAAGCASGFGNESAFDASTRLDGSARLDATHLDAMRLETPDAQRETDAQAEPDAPNDIGRDAGTPDSCSVDADCSDGDACNGIEQCEANRCNAGTAMNCNDSVSCTVDSCVSGACNHQLDDTRCASGQSCSATGCVASTPTCSESPCKLVSPQCGCPSGQSCQLNGTSRACGSVGTLREGDSCTSNSSCAAGLHCADVSTQTGTSASVCSRYCTTDSDCSGFGSVCAWPAAAGSSQGVCTISCDPIWQTGCDNGFKCDIFSASATRHFTECVKPPGTRFEYQSCVDQTDCGPGTVCISDGYCRLYCQSDTDCTFGDICYAFSPSVTISGEPYGFCDY
jgi:hypothetical protein